MADIDTPPSDSRSSEPESVNPSSVMDRSYHQAKEIADFASSGFGLFGGIVFAIVFTPLVLLGMLLRRVLPLLGVLAIGAGILVLGGVWLVPELFMDSVTHSAKVATAGNVVLVFIGGGIGMVILGGVIDELLERYFPEKE